MHPICNFVPRGGSTRGLTREQTFPLSLPPQQRESQLTKQPNPHSEGASLDPLPRWIPQAHRAHVQGGTASPPPLPLLLGVTRSSQRTTALGEVEGDGPARPCKSSHQSTTLTNLPAKGGPARPVQRYSPLVISIVVLWFPTPPPEREEL